MVSAPAYRKLGPGFDFHLAPLGIIEDNRRKGFPYNCALPSRPFLPVPHSIPHSPFPPFYPFVPGPHYPSFPSYPFLSYLSLLVLPSYLLPVPRFLFINPVHLFLSPRFPSLPSCSSLPFPRFQSFASCPSLPVALFQSLPLLSVSIPSITFSLFLPPSLPFPPFLSLNSWPTLPFSPVLFLDSCLSVPTPHFPSVPPRAYCWSRLVCCKCIVCSLRFSSFR